MGLNLLVGLWKPWRFLLLERLKLSIRPAGDQIDLEIGNLRLEMNQKLALFRRQCLSVLADSILR